MLSSMQENHWQKIETIFNEAAVLPLDERQTLVRRKCAGDEELYREVWRLVEDDIKENEFLQEPVFTLGAQIIEGDFLEMPEQIEFASYKLQKLLGRGGMGAVFLAQDARLNRSVALKLLPKTFAETSEAVLRFQQEARAASNVAHQNIAHIYEFASFEGRYFLAMEYVRGRTLRDLIKEKSIDLPTAVDFALQIASALAAAHRNGIIHRDIKPENIVVTEEGLIKVLDFGLAKFTEPPDVNFQSNTSLESIPGVIMGTTAYMSPEQIRSLALDERTDVWSLGVVLYEMLAGHRPFRGDTPSDCSASILKTDLPDIAAETKNVSPELQRIVKKALAKKREDRYQKATDFLAELKNLRREMDLQAALELSSPDFQTIRTDSNHNEPTAIQNYHSNKQTARTHGASETDSSAEEKHTRSKIKRHKLVAGVVLTVLIFGSAAAFYFARFYRKNTVSSIAVLPFVNDGGDPNAEYLSDGISESLINNLSQLQEVKVIARSSSFKFKGKETDPREAAKILGVQAVITGRIVRLGEQLIVSVEMINAADGSQIWGEQYSRKTSKLLQIQSEISQEIAGKLRVKLTGAQEERIGKSETTANPQAYELLLKGRYYWNKGGTENRKKAIEFYNQAIITDSDYAPAYADLSIGYILLVSNGVLDPKEFTSKADEAASKALELDSELADAHLALAYIKLNDWQWTDAEREYKRAVRLNPNLARAHDGYAYYLSFMGRHDEAVAENKRAKDLDPISLVTNANAGNIRYLARQYDEGLAELKNAAELDQNFATTYVYFGYIYTAKGMYREAVASYQKASRLSGDTTSRRIFMGAAYAKAGERAKAHEILKQLETGKEYVSPCELAVLYGALEMREQAFASLEKAYAAHDLQLQYIGVDPAFDSLRGDVRFQDLLKRVGIFI
ncbi:MAG: protein kinase [Acidobacteriota bacterium]|nr:protein kinase [Acidobacteriota bacterium]